MPAPKDPVAYARYIENLKKWRKDPVTRERWIKSISRALTGVPSPKPPGFGERQSKRQKGIPKSPESVERMRKTKTGVPNPNHSKALLAKNGTGDYLNWGSNPLWRKSQDKCRLRDRVCRCCLKTEEEYQEEQKLRGKKHIIRLDIHHILSADDCPDLRFEMANLISLCRLHHNRADIEYRKSKNDPTLLARYITKYQSKQGKKRIA